MSGETKSQRKALETIGRLTLEQSYVTETRGTRKRPIVQITLSDDERARLDEMARRTGRTRSGMVAQLIRDAEMPRPLATPPRAD